MTIRIISLVFACLALAINIVVLVVVTRRINKFKRSIKQAEKELKNFHWGEYND